jgi:hypothetical protein
MIKNPQKETRPPFSTGVTNIGEPRKKTKKQNKMKKYNHFKSLHF